MNRWVIAHKKMPFAFVAPPRRGSWVLASTDGPPVARSLSPSQAPLPHLHPTAEGQKRGGRSCPWCLEAHGKEQGIEHMPV